MRKPVFMSGEEAARLVESGRTAPNLQVEFISCKKYATMGLWEGAPTSPPLSVLPASGGGCSSRCPGRGDMPPWEDADAGAAGRRHKTGGNLRCSKSQAHGILSRFRLCGSRWHFLTRNAPAHLCAMEFPRKRDNE